jgi:hypothetical protein
MSQTAAPPRWTSSVVPLMIGAVLGANVLTMSLANFFEVPTTTIAFIYTASLAVCAWLFVRSGVVFPSISGREHLLCIAAGLVLFLPRAPYLIEGALGYAVNAACPDDWSHIQELASMVYSDRYPIRTTFDREKLLGFYYAAWMPGAATFSAASAAGVGATVKLCLGLTILLYSACFAYAIAYMAKILFADRRLQVTCVVAVLLYGGFDFLWWLARDYPIPTTRAEWWTMEFGFFLQFSNITTLALWVPHHLAAAVAIGFALFVMRDSTRMPAWVLAGLLFLSAVFSSAFVALGAVPLVAWFFLRHGSLKAIATMTTVFVVFSAPLWWIYVGKEEVGFRILGALSPERRANQLGAFGAFLIVLLLEFLPLLAAAFAALKNRAAPAGLLAGAIAYLLSTFVVAYSGFNNYAMRGAIVPIFVLTVLAVPALTAWWRNGPVVVRALLAVYLLGSPLAYAAFARGAVDAFNTSRTDFNAAALESNTGTAATTDPALVERGTQQPMGWYLLERNKLSRKEPIEEIDLELMTSDSRLRFTLARLIGALRPKP